MIHGDPHRHIAQHLDDAQHNHDPALGQDHHEHAFGTTDWHGHTLENTEDGSLVDGPLLDYGEGDGIIGTPEHDQFFWQHQTTGFDCAVVAQLGIINEFTGENLSEAELVYEATANGWLTDHGTSPEDVGRLLDAHGIENHTAHQAEMADVMAELAMGHKVLVGVDADELWDPNHPLHDFTRHSANHAIWVTGVDINDPDHPKVIINDSGHPDGRSSTYDLKTFLDGWESSGYTYVATDWAPRGLAERCPDFDSDSGTFSGLVHAIQDHIPDFLIYGASALVGSVIGEVTGSALAQTAGHSLTHSTLNRLVHPSQETKLLAPGLATLSQEARDRIIEDI